MALDSYEANLLFFGGRIQSKLSTHIIMNGNGERCIWCAKECNESCLLMRNTYDGDIIFCGECVYYLSDKITRPSTNIARHRAYIIRKENERIAKENEERERIRKRIEFLSKYCCKKMGKLMLAFENRYDGIEIYDQGKVKFVEKDFDCDAYDCSCDLKVGKIRKFNFKYCPYCRKEFIRKKE